MARGLDGNGVTYLWQKMKSYVNTFCSNMIDSVKIPEEIFTKTIGGAINGINYSEGVVLDIGFTPKCFEFIGIGKGVGLYLRWDETNEWTDAGNIFCDYDVDLNSNTITINVQMSLTNCDFIWRAFG